MVKNTCEYINKYKSIIPRDGYGMMKVKIIAHLCFSISYSHSQTHTYRAPCMFATTKLTTEFLPCFCQSWLITLQRSLTFFLSYDKGSESFFYIAVINKLLKANVHVYRQNSSVIHQCNDDGFEGVWNSSKLKLSALSLSLSLSDWNNVIQDSQCETTETKCARFWVDKKKKKNFFRNELKTE